MKIVRPKVSAPVAFRLVCLPLYPSPAHDVTLLTEEQLALGRVLSDPMAAERGPWIDTLRHKLTHRGFSDALATVTLGRLARRGILEDIVVSSPDPGRRRIRSPTMV